MQASAFPLAVTLPPMLLSAYDSNASRVTPPDDEQVRAEFLDQLSTQLQLRVFTADEAASLAAEPRLLGLLCRVACPETACMAD